MTFTWIENEGQLVTNRILTRIVESLGLTLGDLEPTHGTPGYRVAFEQNFFIELHEAICHKGINNPICRASTRLSKLGHSLTTQELQVQHAMRLAAEVQEDIPVNSSLSISNHDNCLRLCMEIDQAPDDELLLAFQSFVDFSFAFKQMYLKYN